MSLDSNAMKRYSVDLIVKLKRSPLIPVMSDAVAVVNSKTRKKRNGRSRSTSPQPQEYAVNGEVFVDSAAMYDQQASLLLNNNQGGNWWEQPQFQQPPQQYLGLQHFTGGQSTSFGSTGQDVPYTQSTIEIQSSPIGYKSTIAPPLGFEQPEEKSQFLHSMMRRRSQTLQALADVNGDISKLQDRMSNTTIESSDDTYDRLVKEANMITSRR